MEKLKDEEYKIWEEDLIKPRKKSMQEIMTEVLHIEKSYFNNKINARKKNIRAGRDAMDGILINQVVKNLFELGEIDYKDAIKLDYYATLSPEIRRSYCRLAGDVLSQEVDLYDNLNNTLAKEIVDFRTQHIFAKSSLNFARTLCMKSSEYEKLSKGQVHRKLSENYNNYMSNYESIVTHMGDMLFQEMGNFTTSMFDLDMLRKATASNIAHSAKMLDCYEIVNQNKGSLYFYGAITVLRECSLSREMIKDVKNSPKVYSRALGDGFSEIVSHKEKSDLIVLDDSKDTINPVQERSAE